MDNLSDGLIPPEVDEFGMDTPDLTTTEQPEQISGNTQTETPTELQPPPENITQTPAVITDSENQNSVQTNSDNTQQQTQTNELAEQTEPTFKINGQSFKQSELVKQAQEHFGTNISEFSPERIKSLVEDYVYIKNKSVADSIYDQKRDEIKNKLSEISNKELEISKMKSELELKNQQADKFLNDLINAKKNEIENIDKKLTDTDLSPEDRIEILTQKKFNELSLQEAEQRKQYENQIAQEQSKKITELENQIWIEKNLNQIYSKYPSSKPSLDIDTILQNIKENKEVDPIDARKAIAIRESLIKARESGIPADTYFSIFAPQFENNSVNAHFDNKQSFNEQINTIKNNVQNTIPVTPNADRPNQFVDTGRTREEVLNELQF